MLSDCEAAMFLPWEQFNVLFIRLFQRITPSLSNDG